MSEGIETSTITPFTPNQPTSHVPTARATTIKVGDITVEEGLPPEAPKGGSTGRSKYEAVFTQVRTLEPGKRFVRVPVEPGNAAKDLAHMRTALKRQGKFETDDVKVKLNAAKDELHIWMPEKNEKKTA